MSTHCNVFLEKADGTFTGTYCHYDGYPSGVGAELEKMSYMSFKSFLVEAQRGGGFRSIAGGISYLTDGVPCVLNNLSDEGPCDVEYTYIKCLDGGVDLVIEGRRYRERSATPERSKVKKKAPKAKAKKKK